MRLVLLSSVVVLSACPTPMTVDAGDPFAQPGPYAVGVSRVELSSTDGGRSLTVELWYPADESARAASSEGFGVETFESGARQEQLRLWVEVAPAVCTPRRALGARDAPVSGARTEWPLVMFSHCTECFRFSFHSVAERLASQGFVVAAPDHLDNTRFDATAPLTNAFLATRANDVSDVITALVSGKVALLAGKVDATRVAAMGHSFGAVTTGKVVEQDARVRAGLLFAAPVDSPFLNSGSSARIGRPLSWVLAMEDNSISYLGNGFIRENFTKVPRPNWLVEVENAGHWTFSDIAGLGGDYVPGCGEGKRDPDGGVFTYVDNGVGRGVAMRTASAWAKFVLEEDEAARAALSVEVPAGVVHVKQR